jgi:hypothetical protein
MTHPVAPNFRTERFSIFVRIDDNRACRAMRIARGNFGCLGEVRGREEEAGGTEAR